MRGSASHFGVYFGAQWRELTLIARETLNTTQYIPNEFENCDSKTSPGP